MGRTRTKVVLKLVASFVEFQLHTEPGDLLRKTNVGGGRDVENPHESSVVAEPEFTFVAQGAGVHYIH